MRGEPENVPDAGLRGREPVIGELDHAAEHLRPAAEPEGAVGDGW